MIGVRCRISLGILCAIAFTVEPHFVIADCLPENLQVFYSLFSSVETQSVRINAHLFYAVVGKSFRALNSTCFAFRCAHILIGLIIRQYRVWTLEIAGLDCAALVKKHDVEMFWDR